MAGGPGFEPRLTESESAVLPLNYPPPAPRRVSGAGLRPPFSNFHFGVPQTGSIVDRDRFAECPSSHFFGRPHSKAHVGKFRQRPSSRRATEFEDRRKGALVRQATAALGDDGNNGIEELLKLYWWWGSDTADFFFDKFVPAGLSLVPGIIGS